MTSTRILVPAELTERHRAVVLKYFEKTDRLRLAEWKLALESFDTLGRGQVVVGRKQATFRQFYDRAVDRRHADAYLDRLFQLDDPGTQAVALENEVAAAVFARLEDEGLYREDVEHSEYLAAYCQYWWSAFARGYAQEAIVFRDLRESDIAFVAHDPRKRAERHSAYDLIVRGQLGDVKTSTYFLHVARSTELTCDFYLTRLYDARRRRYLRVAVLTERAWQALDGDVVVASLDAATTHFPSPVGLEFGGRRLVVVPYDLWKAKVKQRQQEEA